MKNSPSVTGNFFVKLKHFNHFSEVFKTDFNTVEAFFYAFKFNADIAVIA